VQLIPGVLGHLAVNVSNQIARAPVCDAIMLHGCVTRHRDIDGAMMKFASLPS